MVKIYLTNQHGYHLLYCSTSFKLPSMEISSKSSSNAPIVPLKFSYPRLISPLTSLFTFPNLLSSRTIWFFIATLITRGEKNQLFDLKHYSLHIWYPIWSDSDIRNIRYTMPMRISWTFHIGYPKYLVFDIWIQSKRL